VYPCYPWLVWGCSGGYSVAVRGLSR